MPQSPLATEPDFELQMRSLAEEAQQFLDVGDRTEKKPEPVLLDFLRPLVQRLESLGRAVSENTMAVMRLEESAASHASLPRLLSSVHEDIESKNRINQKLFDALHDELRSYKDGFLLEVLHRPVARDLVTLFDDLSELHRQTEVFMQKTASSSPHAEVTSARQQVTNLATNLDHVIESLLEVMARMDVRRADPSGGKLDKHTQRVLHVEPARSAEEDLTVVASLKPRFIWRERTLRPEEVVVKKWRPEEDGAVSRK